MQNDGLEKLGISTGQYEELADLADEFFSQFNNKTADAE